MKRRWEWEFGAGEWMALILGAALGLVHGVLSLLVGLPAIGFDTPTHPTAIVTTIIEILCWPAFVAFWLGTATRGMGDSAFLLIAALLGMIEGSGVGLLVIWWYQRPM